MFKQPDALMRIGRAYLSTVPVEVNEAGLREQVFTGWSPTACDVAPRDRGVFLRWIVAQSKDDFRRGRVVQVDGWILSRTEASLCALLAVTC
jgi:hypothetical protein